MKGIQYMLLSKDELVKIICEHKDKLRRRNMQIKDLKTKMETLQSWVRVYIPDKDILAKLKGYFI